MSEKPAISELTPYQKKLFWFLGVATFFEGYDFMALSQVLNRLRGEFSLDKAQGGTLVSVIGAGTIVAFLLVRAADRFGRKRVLTITIVGYTIATFITGLTRDVYSFAVVQFVARMFLIAEWATSNVMAAEEFPADRRGMVVGVIQGCSSLGAIVCAGVVPILLDNWGWRSVYFVGVIPLVLMAFWRKGLKESRRFEEVAAKATKRRSLFAIWSTPHVGRLLKMSLIWGLTYACSHSAVTFWKEFVISERGFSEAQAGSSISIAAVVAMPLVFYSGKLLDQRGRRQGALIIFLAGSGGILAAYGLHGRWPLTIALIFGIFGASGMLPVLNAFTTELFPTESRADAFAWSNNLLGRVGYALSPALVGFLAKDYGWGRAVQFTVIGPLLALVLIWIWLPETNRLELEETAAV